MNNNHIHARRRLDYLFSRIPVALLALYAADGRTQEITAGAGNIEEIFVTAQKRAEPLEKVPISITVISAEDLTSSGAKNLSELQGMAPAVTFGGDTAYTGANISMRGTAGVGQVFGDDPVAIYVDGVNIARSNFFATSVLLDVAAIEIVRGPQGTLQGRNATAGAVLFRTADPEHELGGYIRASAADPEEWRVQAAITGPLSESVSARLALGFVEDRGWASNTFNGGRLGSSRNLQGRAVVRWDAADNLYFRASADYSDTESRLATARWAQTVFNPSATGPLVLPGTATPDVPLTRAAMDAIENGDIALNRPNFDRTENGGVTIEGNYSLGGADLISVSAFRSGSIRGANDSDGFARTDREAYNAGGFDAEQFSQELRLQSATDGRLSWILGGYYFHEQQDLDLRIFNLAATVPIRQTIHFLSAQETDSYAAFADATLGLTDQWALTAGARYTRDSRELQFDQTVTNIDTGAALVNIVYRPAEAVDEKNTYRVKVAYTPTDRLLIYASQSRGFKSGGFNAQGTEPAFRPEVLDSTELGAKARFLDGRAFVSGAVYRNSYENLQIRAGVPTGGIAIFNAATSRIEGFELEGSFEVSERFSVQANTAYIDAKFRSFPTARDIFNTTVDASGNRLPRAPRWQYFVAATYQRELAGDWRLAGETNYSWRDDFPFTAANQSSPTLGSRELGELGARLSFMRNDGYRVSLFGNNILDERSPNDVTLSLSYPNVSFNRPRTLGIEFEKAF